MPVHVRTIELYTCQFRCGHKADVEYKILNHEENCYCNPANKSCRICTNCKIEGGFLKCDVKKLYFKISKKNPDADTKVYNKNKEVVWEIMHISIDDYLDNEKLKEKENNNNNRPFPTKSCEHFVLGKKVF